jgi:hypothetical protein
LHLCVFTCTVRDGLQLYEEECCPQLINTRMQSDTNRHTHTYKQTHTEMWLWFLPLPVPRCGMEPQRHYVCHHNLGCEPAQTTADSMFSQSRVLPLTETHWFSTHVYSHRQPHMLQTCSIPHRNTAQTYSMDVVYTQAHVHIHLHACAHMHTHTNKQTHTHHLSQVCTLAV